MFLQEWQLYCIFPGLYRILITTCSVHEVCAIMISLYVTLNLTLRSFNLPVIKIFIRIPYKIQNQPVQYI